MKRKRQAVWRECIWCKARGIEPPYRSGKLKILERHMVTCQAAHSLEQQNLADTRPKIDIIMALVQLQQKQIADLTARMAVVEQRKRKPIDPTNYWYRLTPKQCWANRRENAIRMMEGVRKMYTPKPYHENEWDFFIWYFPQDIDAATILMSALWPCLEKRDDKTCLRGIETDDPYCIFKNIWGKQLCKGADFGWYIEALQAVGVPPAYYNAIQISREGDEFQSGIMKFQNTRKKVNGGSAPQGLVRLVRIWRKTEVDEEVREVCTALPPRTVTTSEIQVLPDPCPEESVAIRDDSTFSLGPQSSTGTPPDFVSVRCV